MSFLPNWLLSNFSEEEHQNLSHFFRNFRAVCEGNPPPYEKASYSRRFRELATDPVWFANLLASNAYMEGYSAKQIWAYSQSITDAEVASNVRSHARDEAKHAKVFVKMIDQAFPGSLNTDVRSQLKQLSPILSFKEVPSKPLMTEEQVLNTLIQVNIFEIQALILQYLLRPPLLAHSPSNVHPRLLNFCASLITDERRHIKYTALHIEQAIARGQEEFVYSTMTNFQKFFNQMTLENIEQENFEL